MTTTTHQRRWFIDVYGVWHRQAQRDVAECGARAARGIGPMMIGGAPANGIVCEDCEDDP
ncbi:hypothetical protein [Jiangella muralis]|uniref:hypothetical protein n=1 Tax=Jiangella muralis TaxID=702383 RepID=UPI00069D73BF|nr:hypothetical protein [Jiangella muralis]